MMPRLAVLVAAIMVCAGTVRAHDPYESFTLATIRDDDLELNMTMAQSTALKLIDPQNKIAGLTIENFSKHSDRLIEAGRGMFVVTSLKGALVVRRVTVELTEENDVSFKIFYPRPAPGRVHFHAAFLKKLGDGYGGIIDSTDAEGRQLGWEQISWENPNLEITVLPPGTIKKKQ